jgi:hypothetical protein
MQTLPDLYPGKLYLVQVTRPLRRHIINATIARLALRGTLRVLDGGNRFDAHGIARALRLHTHHLKAALERIQVRRAFTCYQVITLLADTPLSTTPTLVLDMLTTFYDENVSLPERQRLLEICLGELVRLRQRAVVLVTAAATIDGQDDPLLERLEIAADQMMRFELEEPRAPLRLF